MILVDKPLDWTSHDAVNKIRGAMRSVVKRRNFKVGHAGTLDPLASGLLIMAYGPRTKELPTLTGLEKVYTGTITLGSTTPSYDLETTPEPGGPWEHLDEAAIHAAFARFHGEVMQRPPNYSAKRFEGERAYWMARDSERAHLVDMPAVKVIISSLEVKAIRGADIDFRGACEQRHLYPFARARHRPVARLRCPLERASAHGHRSVPRGRGLSSAGLGAAHRPASRPGLSFARRRPPFTR